MVRVMTMSLAALLLGAVDANVYVQTNQAPCPGDTRGPQGTVVCNHDATHRVCAKIGEPDTSFWTHTGQHAWCGQDLYREPWHNQIACPPAHPTWCICKWATASWIQGEWPDWQQPGSQCPDSIDIRCESTDICNTSQGLFFSYTDYNVNLGPAHNCVKQKCSEMWEACAAANASAVTNGGHWSVGDD